MNIMPLVDTDAFGRDVNSKALVSIDMKAKQANRQKIRQSSRIKQMEIEINSLKAEIAELRELIIKGV